MGHTLYELTHRQYGIIENEEESGARRTRIGNIVAVTLRFNTPYKVFIMPVGDEQPTRNVLNRLAGNILFENQLLAEDSDRRAANETIEADSQALIAECDDSGYWDPDDADGGVYPAIIEQMVLGHFYNAAEFDHIA